MRPLLMLAVFCSCLLSVTNLVADEAADLLKAIQAEGTSDVDRANAFQKIGDVADEDAIEPLAAYLSDKKWSHYARFAFQKMKGDVVTQTLLKSVDTLDGDLQLGVIDTIGRRRDPIAAARLTQLLVDPNAKLAAAAAVALGEIGTPDAAQALTKALDAEKDADRRESLASASLLVGQRLANQGHTEEAVGLFDHLRAAPIPKPYRIGATQSAILQRGAAGADLMIEQLKSADRDAFQVGLAVARVLPGDATTQRLTGALKTEQSSARQELLILALNDRADRAALPAVLEKLKSDSADVQLAAISAVGTLGDGSTVAALLSVANDENSEAVLRSLVALEGTRVNRALLDAAKSSKVPRVALKALGRRRAQEAIPVLFELSRSDSAETSQEAIVALGRTVSADRFLDLFKLLKSAQSDERKKAIQEAIQAAVFRTTEPDACAAALGSMIPSSRGADREFLFDQLRTAGGKKAVALMTEYATGSDEALQDAATKTLGRWLSADAAPTLLQVAQGKGKFANRAMGGYIRIFRQFELPEAERVAMAAQALKVVRRPNERNAAIEAMTRFPCVGTFKLALEQLDVPKSEQVAGRAVLTIGRTVLQLDPPTAKVGLQKLIDAKVSKNLSDSARALLPKE